MVSDCLIRLFGPWSPSISGEDNSLYRLECILNLSSRLILKTTRTFLAFGKNLNFHAVQAEVLGLNPIDGLHNTGSHHEWKTKTSFTLNIAFTAAGWLSTLASATFSPRRSGCWHCKWLFGCLWCCPCALLLPDSSCTSHILYWFCLYWQ